MSWPRTVYLINEVNLAVRTRMERALRDHELTVAQYSVMSLLVSPPKDGREGISSAKIARARRVSPQSINELIVGLETRGLVARLGDPDNRRELLVSLTRIGRDKLTACDAAIDDVERELFADLDAATHKHLRSILNALVGTIRRTDKGRDG
jgi:DNA-binding MarR family transcriptional regulator